MRQTRSLIRRFAVLSVVALSLVAQGDPPKPRVMIILDTSRSMRELPKWNVPSDQDVLIAVDPLQKGDYDPTLDNDCLNKFCTAKKVLYNVIPQYTADARIGLTTYYQYVLNVNRNDSQQTTCFYDVLSPPNVVRTYTSRIDFTGSGLTTCPGGPSDVTCPAATRAFTFPDITASGTGDGLNGRCAAATGYTSVTDPALPGGTCANAGVKGCYQVTKTAAAAAAPVTCAIGTYPVPALPRAYTAATCATATTYNAVSSTTMPSLVGAAGNPLRKYVSLATATCTGTPEMPSLSPGVAPAETIASINAGTGSTVGQFYLNGNTLTCTSEANCSLFLHSSTPSSTNSTRHWYGLFSGPPPNPTYAGPNSYNLSAQTNAAAYVASLLTGSVTIAASSSCNPTNRYTSGSLTDFGITNALGTLNASVVRPPVVTPASVNETPTTSGTNFTCNADWPCDVTLTSQTVFTPPPLNLGTIYNPSAVVAPQYTGAPSGNNTLNLQGTAAGSTSCPSAGSLASNGTAPAGWAWTAGTGCGTGTLACSFTASGSTSVTAPAGQCNSPITVSDGSTPAVCAFNGKSYVAGATTTVNVTRDMPGGSTCVAAPGTIASAGSPPYSGCTSYPCTLTAASPLTTVGPLEYSNWQNSLTPPSGYTGPYAQTQNVGGQTTGPLSAASTGSCPTGVVTSSDAAVCGGSTPCVVNSLGYQQISTGGCGSENSPCYACRYQPVQVRWSRNTVRCNYTAQSRTWTVDRTALQCSYTRPYVTLYQPQPDQRTCNYAVGARRYDFSQPSTKWCEYWAIKTTVESPRALYTYQYVTKGTEIIGRGSKQTTGATLCSSTYSTSALATECPATVAGCGGIAGLTNGVTAGIPGGATCKLQWGGSASTTAVGSLTGRYGRYSATGTTWDVNRACEESANPPADPNTYKARSANPWGFCSDSGQPAQMSRYLISDWYDPSQTNNINVWSTYYPSSGSPSYTVTWNNTATKKQGFGAHEVFPAAGGSGALPNASLFVPIPSDAVYDPDAQNAAIKSAVSKCILPSQTPPSADGRLAGGACVSDMQNAAGPGASGVTCSAGKCSNIPSKSCSTAADCWVWQDFTPLYGSLKNTYNYLLDRWQQEDGTGCRDYFIVLATDGAENTPKGYVANGTDPATSVQGLVASFRDSTGTKPDVKTFVIAFGENIGSLDSVASAGGTNQAFTANSQSELQTALASVFTTITQGTFSRSRPALSTDGNRLYAAQYIKPAAVSSTMGADWSGLLTAYRVGSDGSFTPAWEASAKLNDPSHPARTIRVALRDSSSNLGVGNFTSGNATLMSQLDTGPDWSFGMSKNDVINFLRGDNTVTYFTKTNTRSSKLGPIVTSAPVVVAKSPYDTAWGGTTSAQTTAYSSFIAGTATRAPRVLFQANDAMLHSVIEGDTSAACTSLGDSAPTCPNGREAWALIPGTLYSGYQWPYGMLRLVERLPALQKGQWAESLLDNTLAVSDVCGKGADFAADGCTDAADWKTIAIGTQRAGGRGMYAVDVTQGTVPDTARFLWDFWDDDLGFSYSVPAIGRVKNGGKDYFVAIFGAGKDDPGTGAGDIEGKRVFVVRAVDGFKIKEFNKFDRGASEQDLDQQVLARPATWRRPGRAYMDSAFIGVGSSLYALRFAKPGTTGDQHDNADKWKPDEFFDPTSTRNDKKSTLSDTVVNRVVITTPGTLTTPPVYGLQYVKNLPLTAAEAPPIYNRPKTAALLVPSGAVPDLYVGTGDVADPQNPGPAFSNGNYFYAVHDKNEQPKGDKNDGVPLWVVKFDGKEQVVSEPAIISGCIIVATYTPPAAASLCGAAGDTRLYGFSPLTGELTACLNYPAGSQYAGSSTSVVTLSGAGIPSDLVVVNDNVYLSTSQGGLQRAPVRQVPRAGNVRSYRRIK